MDAPTRAEILEKQVAGLVRDGRIDEARSVLREIVDG
jgi:hypothetical protein